MQGVTLSRSAWIARIALGGLFTAFAGAAMADQTVVKLWMHEFTPRLPLDQKYIEAFEVANPDIKIDYQIIPDANFDTRLATSFAGGNGPDVWNQLSLYVGQQKAANILAPIDLAAAGFADEAAIRARYATGLDGIIFDGKIYGLPTEVSNFMCFANNELFVDAGLDASKDFPRTWEDMVKVADKLTKRDSGGNPTQRGFDFKWGDAIYTWLGLNPMITQIGGTMIDEAKGSANLDSSQAIRVFQYWSDWANVQKLGGPQYTDSSTDFLSGKLAMSCSFGTWGIPEMKDAKIDWSIHPVPRWADATSDNGNDDYAFYMMVNANADPKVQEAAWKFIGFYTSHAAELFSTAGLFTPVPEVINSAEFKALDYMPLVLAELAKGKFSPRIAGFGPVGDLITEARDRIVSGNEEPAYVLPGLNEEVNSLLAAQKIKASSN